MSFKFVLAVKPSLLLGEEISSIAKNSGNDFFIGTSRGRLLKYRTKKVLHRNQEVTFTSQEQAQQTLGNNPINQIEAEAVGTNFLVVLCGSVITLHSQKDLQVLHVLPKYDPFSICLSDCGHSSFRGLCIASKKRVILYDLQNVTFVACARTIAIKDQPIKAIKSMKNYVCIGFPNEYYIVPTKDSSSGSSFSPGSQLPVIELLPTEEFALAVNKTVILISPTGKQTREAIQFNWTPIQLAFTFPFLAALSVEAVEVRNLMDKNFHDVPARMPTEGIRILITDGKDLVAACSNKVYVVKGREGNAYMKQDPAVFATLRENPSDVALFTKYFKKTILNDPKNPFGHLLAQYSDELMKKFHNYEEADLQQLKKYLVLTQKKLYRLLLLHFTEFKSKSSRQLMRYSLQKAYYSKVFFSVMAVISSKVCFQDLVTTNNSREYISPSDLGLKKLFLLNKSSLTDPPKQTQSPDDLAGVDEKNVTTQSFIAFLGQQNLDSVKDQMEFGETIQESPSVTIEEVSKSIMDQKPDKDIFELLLRIPASQINRKSSFGQSVLYTSCRAGRIEIVKKLVQVDGIEFVGPQNTYQNNTPLHGANWGGHVQIVAMLLTLGAKPECNNSIPHRMLPSDEGNPELPPTVFKDLQNLWLDYYEGGTAAIVKYLPKDWTPKMDASAEQQAEKKSSTITEENEDGPLQYIEVSDEQPYGEAISVIRKITKEKTPKDKLDCIVKTFQATINCIYTFWDRYRRRPVIGTDDLVSIMTYILLEAAIPKLYSEMTFIHLLATDKELDGNYGYAFATFQIGVEVIASLKENLGNDGILDSGSTSGGGSCVGLGSGVMMSIADMGNELGNSTSGEMNVMFEKKDGQNIAQRKTTLTKTFSFSLWKRSNSTKRVSKIISDPKESPQDGKINKNISMSDVIMKHRNAFFNFLAQEKNEGYLLCLEAISVFEKNPTLSHAEEILSTFITTPHPTIYVPPKMKEAVEHAVGFGEISSSTFMDIKYEVTEVLELNSFSRFVSAFGK